MKSQELKDMAKNFQTSTPRPSQQRKRVRASVSGSEGGTTPPDCANSQAATLHPPPPPSAPPHPPPPAKNLPPHPSPYHHSVSFPLALVKDNDGRVSFAMTLTNFPTVTQPESMEDVNNDFQSSMNIFGRHKKSVEELRLKWSDCGELNLTREEFLISAETYLTGYYKLAKKTFAARFAIAVPRANINPSALPLIEGYTFSRRYSADLLKHPEMHHAFNPVAPPPPPAPLLFPPTLSAESNPATSSVTTTPTSTSSSARRGGDKF